MLFVLLSIPVITFSQKNDSTKVGIHFGGAISVNTKGISTIPNLTLGKPAAIFDLSMVRRKLSFEPIFRFALEGKPWTFIFWWRYKLLEREKYMIRLGVNPAVAFKTIPVTTNEVTDEIITAQRTLTGDLTSSYFLTKNISIGPYYMYIYGIEKSAIKNTHYLALRSGFSNIKLSDQFFMRFNPQVYYLKMDKNDGFYFNATLTLAKRNFPLSVSTLINKTIQTEIPIGEDFLWNVSLSYSFNKKYVEQ